MNTMYRILLALVAAFAASGAQAARSENCATDPSIVAMPFLRHGTELKTVDEFVAVFKDGAGKLHKGVTVEMFRREITKAVALARGYNTGAEQPLTAEQVLAVLAEAKVVDAKFLKGEAVVYGFACEVGSDGVQHAEKRQRASLPGERFIAIPGTKNPDGSFTWAVIASTICGNAMEFALKGPAPAQAAVPAPGGTGTMVINNYNIQQAAPATRIEPIPNTGTRIEAIPQVAVAPAVAYAPQVGYVAPSVWPQVVAGLGVAAINAWGGRPVVVTSGGNTSNFSSTYTSTYYAPNIVVNRTGGGPVLGPTGPTVPVGGPVLGNTGSFTTGRPVLGPTGAVGGGPVLR